MMKFFGTYMFGAWAMAMAFYLNPEPVPVWTLWAAPPIILILGVKDALSGYNLKLTKRGE